MGIIERIKEQLEIERERYSRTKVGKIFAFLIIVGMFKTGPLLMEWWNRTFNTPEPHITFIFIYLFAAILISSGFNFSVWALSKLKIPFFEQYRINPNVPWPWEETDPVKAAEIKSVIRYNLIHAGMKYIVIGSILPYFISKVQPTTFLTDMAICPSWWEMLPHLGIIFIVDDFITFSMHWAFHHPLLYRFHKEHHQYKYSIPLTGWHFHYVEWLLLQLLSAQMFLWAAQAYAPLHIGTLMTWNLFRIWNNNSTHCGYIFPWTPSTLIPFSLNDEFHDFHHTHNVGNYGLYLRIWDALFDTTKPFREFKAKQKKMAAEKID